MKDRHRPEGLPLDNLTVHHLRRPSFGPQPIAEIVTNIRLQYETHLDAFAFLRDEHFSRRLCIIVLHSAVGFARCLPERAAELNERLSSCVDAVTLTGGIAKLSLLDPRRPELLVSALHDPIVMAHELQIPTLALELSLRLGLSMDNRLPHLTAGILDCGWRLPEEHQFLATRLVTWAYRNWEPLDRHPFVDFIQWRHHSTPVLRQVLMRLTGFLLKACSEDHHRFDPYKWSWEIGRSFGDHYPDVRLALLEELPREKLTLLGEQSRTRCSPALEITPQRLWTEALTFMTRYRDAAHLDDYLNRVRLRQLCAEGMEFGFWMGVLAEPTKEAKETP